MSGNAVSELAGFAVEEAASLPLATRSAIALASGRAPTRKKKVQQGLSLAVGSAGLAGASESQILEKKKQCVVRRSMQVRCSWAEAFQIAAISFRLRVLAGLAKNSCRDWQRKLASLKAHDFPQLVLELLERFVPGTCCSADKLLEAGDLGAGLPTPIFNLDPS